MNEQIKIRKSFIDSNYGQKEIGVENKKLSPKKLKRVKNGADENGAVKK